jgi:aminopeptidase N
MQLFRPLFLSALILTAASFALGARKERVIDTWRPVNYNVSITLNDSLTEITKARAEITVQILKDKITTVDFDFGELAVDAATINGNAAEFDRSPGVLNIHLSTPANHGNRLVITIDYHGKPKDGLILTVDKDGKPSATGDNWPDRVHHWIPCFDHPSAKATVTFTVTAPARDRVVANGRFVNVSSVSGTSRVWTFTEGVPIPAYCMVIAVGEYANSAISASSVTPLSYYVPQSDGDRAALGFVSAAPSLKFFSETIAPYPYETLALIVGATRFGGMENSSAIVFQGNLLAPRTGQQLSRAFNINTGLEEIVAHEIAHQWFGDSVTESTWADLWLSEGFASYFAGLVIEKYDGPEAFHAYLKRSALTYFQYEKQTRTPIHDTETAKLFDLLNANNYQKGAWVLHMLRSRLGDDAFFRGLKLYYNAHKDATANTEDLRAALEKASGKDLKPFFARWVYGSGHPRYELSWEISKPSAASGKLTITLEQTQPGEAFLDPVPIEVINSADGSGKTNTKRRLWIQPTGKITTAQFPFSKTEVPTSIQVDPDETLLKEAVVTVLKQVRPIAP